MNLRTSLFVAVVALATAVFVPGPARAQGSSAGLRRETRLRQRKPTRLPQQTLRLPRLLRRHQQQHRRKKCGPTRTWATSTKIP